MSGSLELGLFGMHIVLLQSKMSWLRAKRRRSSTLLEALKQREAICWTERVLVLDKRIDFLLGCIFAEPLQEEHAAGAG